MIQHYLKIAVRNLLKYKTQSAISILGLAIGLTCFVFSLHWFRYETSYDLFYPHSDRTYMVCYHADGANTGVAPSVLADYIRTHCPEVELVTRTHKGGGIEYAFDDEVIKQPDFLSVDSFFIRNFPQEMRFGRMLGGENEMIINESTAQKYWGDIRKAVGCTLRQQGVKGMVLMQPRQFTVVGVMADAPLNTSFGYEGYCQYNYDAIDIHDEKNWQFANAQIHVLLREGVSREDFTKHLTSMLGKLDYMKGIRVDVLALNEKHFAFASEESFSYTSIRMFSAASLLLLCCVLFNFLNLFLNRYYKRAREIKLRKSLGANDGGLLGQVMYELLLYCTIGFLLCGCLVEAFIPFFERVFSLSISGYEIWKVYLACAASVLLLMGAILFLPVLRFIRCSAGRSLILKPKTHRHHTFRRVSLVAQLVICLFFLTSTAVLFKQLNFMQRTDLGFEPDNLIELFIEPMQPNGKEMLEEVKRLPMIQSMTSASSYILSKDLWISDSSIEWEGKTKEDSKVQFVQYGITRQGFEVFRFKLKEGRSFSDDDWVSTDGQAKDVLGYSVLNKVLINEKAAAAMRMTQPVGKILRIPFGMVDEGEVKEYYNDYEIIGVVKDFHTQGMKFSVHPTIITQSFRFIQPLNYFRVTPGTEGAAIKAINKLAVKHQWEYKGRNAEPRTVTDKLQELNKSETATFRLFSILTFICMLISLFGIYSLSCSTIEQRRKEIAVRKVMGATVREIIVMFFREYTSLVCLATLVAFPVAYYVMSQWLQQYAYRISIRFDLFIIIAGTTLILVLSVVLQQILRAANQNPAEVIKSE